LPAMFRELLLRLRSHLLELNRQVQALEEQITAWHRTSEDSQRLAQIPGVGVLTASALVASIGDAKCFKNGRELAAWLGLVPRQHSSGGKPLLLGVSKRGDTYLRTLLVHGARSVVRISPNKQTPTDSWTNQMSARRHMNVVCVARANKNVRIAWALLVYQRCYHGEYQLAA
jgi:transposase